MAEGAPAEAAAPWVVNEVARELRERGAQGRGEKEFRLTPALLAELVRLVDSGTLTNRVAKDLLIEVSSSGASPAALAAERGLDQQLDEDGLKAVVSEVIRAHPDELSSYRGGKAGLRGFFIGQVMRRTEGRADPKLVQRLVDEGLGGA